MLTPRMGEEFRCDWHDYDNLNSVDGLRDLLNDVAPGKLAVEIGSHAGVSTAEIAKKFLRVYAIEPDVCYALIATKRANPQIQQRYTTDDHAIRDFKDNSLDFLYIDSIHTYEYMVPCIERWLPKVRSGGYIAGHDHCDLFPGVAQAVAEVLGRVKVYRDYSFLWRKP